ncbi:MAG: NAD-dependent epimerase/dehydratase family protein [Bacteroidales bacterium]
MYILVTGAAGFIGFHLVKELSLRGHRVLGLDNINSYYNINLKYGRLKELGIEQHLVECNTNSLVYIKSASLKNFTFIKCDLTNLQNLTTIFKENKFDKVCNLAAQAGVRYSFENPMTYIQSNIVGFMNILELSKQHNINHFVYASSSSIYGNNAKIPFEESDRTDNPQSIYAATKKADELLAYVYSNQLNLPTTGLRFFTVYGPWGRPDMAPFIFMKSIIDGKPIKVFNNGNLSRDFSYIDDIITGVVKVLESIAPTNVPIYNIGNSSPVKLMDFINTIEKVTGKTAVKEFVGMQKGDVYATFANTSSIENDFEFKPSTPISVGIEKFYEWYILETK